MRTRCGYRLAVAAGLLHLAFWDRFVLERWTDASRNHRATPESVGEVLDLVNDALTPLLLLMPVEAATTQALEAAKAVDKLIAGLPRERVEVIRGEGRPRLIDRSLHREEHLQEIDAVLA